MCIGLVRHNHIIVWTKKSVFTLGRKWLNLAPKRRLRKEILSNRHQIIREVKTQRGLEVNCSSGDENGDRCWMMKVRTRFPSTMRKLFPGTLYIPSIIISNSISSPIFSFIYDHLQQMSIQIKSVHHKEPLPAWSGQQIGSSYSCDS